MAIENEDIVHAFSGLIEHLKARGDENGLTLADNAVDYLVDLNTDTSEWAKRNVAGASGTREGSDKG